MNPATWTVLVFGGAIAFLLWRWINNPLRHVAHLIRAADDERLAGRLDVACRLLQQASELLPLVKDEQARKLARFGVEGDWGMTLVESGRFDLAEKRLIAAADMASSVFDADHRWAWESWATWR